MSLMSRRTVNVTSLTDTGRVLYTAVCVLVIFLCFCNCKFLFIHCALAAAQCIVIGPVCGFVGVFVCLFVCGSVTTITRNCVIDLHQTGFVGKGSDRLQLIKYWPSCAPGKGVCGGVKIFGSALLQPARSVCQLSEHFFHWRCFIKPFFVCVLLATLFRHTGTCIVFFHYVILSSYFFHLWFSVWIHIALLFIRSLLYELL